MLVHAHSGLRWVALLLLVFAIYNAFKGTKSGEFTKKDKMINLFSMVVLHIQLVIGFALYFTSGKVNFAENWMKITQFRFFGLEHLIGMILGIALVTMGYSMAKRIEDPSKKHRKTLVFYTIGLLLILIFIPWPFRVALGSAWF
jgi:ABC-type Na+ efflux pump permease subunit